MLKKKHIDEEIDFQEDDEKISKKDVLAAIIAEFEILLPIVIITAVIMWLLVVLILKMMG